MLSRRSSEISPDAVRVQMLWLRGIPIRLDTISASSVWLEPAKSLIPEKFCGILAELDETGDEDVVGWLWSVAK